MSWSYNMKKLDIEKWEGLFSTINSNRRKILFNPFYNRNKFVKEIYKRHFGKELDIKNPKTFTEKLNAFKVDKRKIKNYSLYADKDKVRDYVKEKVGEKYLIPQLFCKNKITVDDLNKLPKSFVLKANNGSGTNHITLDKNKEDLEEICNYMNWLKTIKYGYIWGEFLYNRIKPKIIAEKLMLDKKGNIPDDLKCFCFIDNNGVKRKILFVSRVVGDERHRIMFDENWKPVDYGFNFEANDFKIKCPDNYKEILHVIDKLSEDFNFVRVDLFVLDKKIYFGELTFIPSAGYSSFNQEGMDLQWGNYIGDNLI